MIGKKDFMGIIQIVVDQFGDKYYGHTRSELIYRAVCRLEPSEFKRICETLVGNSRYAPMLQEFVDLARPMLNGKPKSIQKRNIFFELLSPNLR